MPYAKNHVQSAREVTCTWTF